MKRSLTTLVVPATPWAAILASPRLLPFTKPFHFLNAEDP